MNRKQLDAYHSMTIRNATQAFRTATAASVVAFTMLIIGAVYSLQNTDVSARYVAGGLTALGAVLTAFLARTFLVSWRDTNRELKKYYDEPSRTGRLLTIERLASSPGPEDRLVLRGQVRDDFVRALLAEFVQSKTHDYAEPTDRKVVDAPGAGSAFQR